MSAAATDGNGMSGCYTATVRRLNWQSHRTSCVTPSHATDEPACRCQLSKLMGHAQVTTTQIYPPAQTKLAAAYQTAMAQLSSRRRPTPEPRRLAPAVAVLPSPPSCGPGRPADEAPIEIHAHCLAYYEHCRPTWNPPTAHSADSLLYSLEGFWRWQSAQRPISRLVS